jgi:hypothetical protein
LKFVPSTLQDAIVNQPSPPRFSPPPLYLQFRNFRI